MSGEAMAAIVAEMRDFAEHLDYDSDGNMSTTLMRVFADRIEAAWKRECEAVEADALLVGGFVEATRHRPGNAAAMREALEVARSALIGWQTCTISRTEHRDAIAAVNAALAAPARNCDVGSPKEQAKRYHATGQLYHTLTLTNVLQWAQAPYKEAERK